MTSFGWKRKIGDKVSQDAAAKFSQESKSDLINETASVLHDGDLAVFNPKYRRIQLEDAAAKSHRLKQEGTTLADAERYWEAVKRWDAAIQLNPNDETLHEMKAQALLILHEVYPAVEAASKAIQLNPRWWIGYQTLGRVHLGIGEVRMAIKSFSKAVHIKPDDSELWNEDLLWACSLLKQKQKPEDEQNQQINENKLTITEISDSNSHDNSCGGNLLRDAVNSSSEEDTVQQQTFVSCTSKLKKSVQPPIEKTGHMPKGYVLMRDK
ncbi:tetratricopeptide repeat protein 33-like [Tubulanus polymorphus]|uniref:tetratricopeptide repeat protein 33-like n=1 Tax=Tubulanus polymorphus TaxID=672921 RepID=UPI003DA3490E